MPGFTSYDSIINAISALTQADDSYFQKQPTAGNVVAGIWHDTWAEIGQPEPGATDAGGTQYVNVSGGSGTSANKGGLGFGTVSVSTKIRNALSFGATSSVTCNVMIYDRLCGISGISTTSTGSKTLTTLPALPRYTSGVGVQAWLSVSTAFTATAPVFYLNSYTGSSNGSATNAGSTNTLTSLSSTAKIGDMVGPFPLLTPDTGVKAIASIDVSTNSTLGAVNVLLIYPLAIIPIQAGIWNEKDLVMQLGGLPQIFDGASLGIAYQNTGTTVPLIYGHLRSAYN